MPRGRVAKTLAQKMAIFDLNTIPEPNSGCLIWLGDLKGIYGYASGSGLGMVHRWVNEEINGNTIPRGMQSCHWCGRAWCVEPTHLYVGTPKQNMADSKRHGTFQIHLDALSSRWELLSEEQRQLQLAKLNEGCRKKWDSQSPEERAHRMRHAPDNFKKFFNTLTPEQQAEFNKSKGVPVKKFHADFKARDPEGYKEWTRARALNSAAKRIENRKKRAFDP